MPKHSKKVNVDEMNPVNQQRGMVAQMGKHEKAMAEGHSMKKHHSRGGKHEARTQHEKDTHQGPQATSLPGALSIIKDPTAYKRDIRMGVPGVITSTSLGPEQRQRLQMGIIESPMMGQHVGGAVHSVEGTDSTAYAVGMVHIAGSPYKK